MERKCLNLMTRIILWVLPILVLAGWGCEFSISTAKLSDAVLCFGVDVVTKKPLDKADVFSQDTPEIFCSVKLSNAPSETSVKSEWIYVKGEVESLSDYTIDEFTLSADGTTYISFSLTRPDTGFPKGEYVLKLFLDDEEKIAVPFKVE